MNGWIYLIKNGDLYKIGITKNFKNRMRQLKPDSIVAKLFSTDFKKLEREFHKRYKSVRIPQTEYFRLDHIQVREVKNRLGGLYYPTSITFDLLVNSIFILLVLFLIIFILTSLVINDTNIILFFSFKCLEKILFIYSFLSLLIKSNRYFNLFNELKFRITRFFILILFSFFVNLAISTLV